MNNETQNATTEQIPKAQSYHAKSIKKQSMNESRKSMHEKQQTIVPTTLHKTKPKGQSMAVAPC